MAKAIEDGLPKRRIEEASARTQARIDSGRQSVVGVNRYRSADLDEIPVLKVDNSAVRQRQLEKLARLKAERDPAAVEKALDALTAGAALTAAQEDVDHLRLSKTFAALYTVRREVSSQDAELAQLKADSESAQTALTNAKAALAAAQERDLGAIKTALQVKVNGAQNAKTKADEALAAAQAEVAKEKTKVVEAKKLVKIITNRLLDNKRLVEIRLFH